jgi:aconitase A
MRAATRQLTALIEERLQLMAELQKAAGFWRHLEQRGGFHAASPANTLQSMRAEVLAAAAPGSVPGVKVERLRSGRIVLESVLRGFGQEGHRGARAPQLEAEGARPGGCVRAGAHRAAGLHRRTLLCDLAAMRGVAAKMGKDPKVIQPLILMVLLVDHSLPDRPLRQQNALISQHEAGIRGTRNATSS